MPEYLAPGVYVEEISFRSKSIEGVGTSTAGFVGPARWGPITGDPELLTSFADFERIYGGLDDLVFKDGQQPNYLAHGVRAFFEEGGVRLYVSRVFNFGQVGYSVDANTSLPASSYASTGNTTLGSPPDSPPNLRLMELVARFPGKTGNMRVTFTLRVGANAFLSKARGGPALTRIQSYDLVYVGKPGSPLSGSPDGLFLAYWNASQNQWELRDRPGETPILPSAWADNTDTQVRPVTVLVEVARPIVSALGAPGFDVPELLGEFSFDPRSANALTKTFTRQPATRRDALTTPFSIELPGIPVSPGVSGTSAGFPMLSEDPKNDSWSVAVDLARDLLGEILLLTASNGAQVSYTLSGGDDGYLPEEPNYMGDGEETKAHDLIDDPLQRAKNGLLAFEGVEDISIVAAPGYSAHKDPDKVFAIHSAVIDHCERMRYRIAVLDTPPKMLVSDALDFRNKRSNKYAALYYPWVTILDPLTDTRLNLPPSGFVAGIYARNDINRSVSKAPANEVVRLAIDFEQRVNKAQQEVLNPEGVNCFRFFSGHGFLLWGARTISDDPEWKYVNLRRYFAYLEHSIDRGTQWVVFENNSQQLWTNVRHTVEDFLFNEWKQGSLMGTKPEEAYFVRCDLTTMTQNDLDNGRLICLIGVAAVRPAEFVIFRIGQWTGTSSNR